MIPLHPAGRLQWPTPLRRASELLDLKAVVARAEHQGASSSACSAECVAMEMELLQHQSVSVLEIQQWQKATWAASVAAALDSKCQCVAVETCMEFFPPSEQC